MTDLQNLMTTLTDIGCPFVRMDDTTNGGDIVFINGRDRGLQGGPYSSAQFSFDQTGKFILNESGVFE